jgi:drug/metabolite transporter (DMT)-like permease
MLYGSLSNILFSLIAICFSGFYSPSSKELFLLFFIGAFGTFSGYCYIQAVRYASPAFVAPFEYTRLLYAIPVGFIFFGEVPSITTLAGASLIVVAVYQLTLYKKRELNS